MRRALTGRFPLSDWIDGHLSCRHILGVSGMVGSVPPPRWPVRRAPASAPEELRAALARHLRVDRRRVFLSHGASEANGWVLAYLARRAGPRAPRLRFEPPEYPPLFDAGRAVGFRPVPVGPAEVAVVSSPRNPEGDLWPRERLERFADAATALLVDETFREFAGSPSVAVDGRPRRWATGSFTKFYGADEVRVGFAVAPPGETEAFGRFVGLVSDEVAPASAATALALLRSHRRVAASVRALLDRNRRAFHEAFPDAPLPVAPLHFDRPGRENGQRLAERCLTASVLVCPGRFFGDPRGVRIGLTRKDFPEAIHAYLGVRDRSRAGRRSARA